MNLSDNTVIDVRAAESDEQVAALALLFSSQPAVVQQHLIVGILEQARNDPQSLAGLTGAWRQGILVGAGWLQVMPGRTAIVWPPELLAGESSETAELIMERLDQLAGQRGIRLAQAVIHVNDEITSTRFHRAGYEKIADLLYMSCEQADLSRDPPVSSLGFQPYQTDQQPRLERLIERTYAQTLDCPRLNGIRRMSDVVGGYLATGEFAANRWFFVVHDSDDVGCLLLTDHPRDDQWELIYMALVPEARGHGWGQVIAEFAQWQAYCAGRARLVLAVDARNTPATNMYTSVGFNTIDQRCILLKVFDASETMDERVFHQSTFRGNKKI